MKKIYGEGALSMLACSRSFIFTSRSEAPAGSKQTEGKAVVSYKQHSFDDGGNSLVTKSVYQMNKFGKNYEFFSNELPDYLNCKAVSLKDMSMLIAYYDGNAAIFDKNCTQKWSGSLKYKGFAPADVVAEGDFLWCSYPESNAVIKYNLNSMQQTFRAGGSQSGGIIEPYGLWLHDNRLIITSSASGVILSLNLDTFYAEELHDVGEPALQYMKIDSNEIVLTRTGIYKL